MNFFTLLRYNFRLMMMSNWPLLVFPLAVSQLTVFWFVLTQRFTPELPAQSVELVTPLLGAFLGAHLLSAEYRSRVGAVLASRPVNIGRILSLRLIVMLALVWGLAGISLMAYTFWMSPFDLAPPVLACIPSTLFLTMLALTFATLFRHSLSGFAVAALYWVLDLVPGAPLHPYLSLRSLTSYYALLTTPDHRTFHESWWQAKVILFVLAVFLYFFHERFVFMLGTPNTAKTRINSIIGAAALIIVYLISGAVVKVGYGYTHRGKLPPSDLAWFRYNLASYGPIPVMPLFGPAFSRYLGEFTNPWRVSDGDESDLLGDTSKHQRDLKYVVDKMPGSMWAPSAADALARILGRRQRNIEDTVAYYQYVIDHYPNSPYVEYALRQIARSYSEAKRQPEARTAYMNLLQKVPGSDYRSEAFRFLVGMDQKAGHLPDAAGWAEKWTESAPIYEKFEAWMSVTEIRKAEGDISGAKQAAQIMMKSLKEYRHALTANEIKLSPTQVNFKEIAAGKAEALAQSLK